MRRPSLITGLLIGAWVALVGYVWLTAGGLTARERTECRFIPYRTAEKPVCLIVRLTK